MSENYIRINGTRRPIDYFGSNSSNTRCFVSVTTNPPVALPDLGTKLKFSTFRKAMDVLGLEYSGVNTRTEYGLEFGLTDVISWAYAGHRVAPKLGNNRIWLGVSPRVDAAKVEINVADRKCKTSELELFGYANVILDKFVPFVENKKNYKL